MGFKVGVILYIAAVFLLSSCTGSSKKNNHALEVNDSFYYLKDDFKPFSSRTIDTIESFLTPDFNGTVLVYRRGMLYKKAYGNRDLKRRERMHIDDVFQLASVSKPVTAVAVMQLVEKGLLNIDSPVLSYLSDFPYKRVTVRHLLNHRSGLANYVYYTDTFWKQPEAPMRNSDLYAFLTRCQPRPYLEPDVSFSYCNTNYTVLATLVEVISGKPFYRYVETSIFQPAGMCHSYYYGHRPARIQSVALEGRYDHYEYKDSYYLDAVLGDKSLVSNVTDLFMFNRALRQGRLLKEATLNMMQQASYKHNVFGGSYGLGFRLLELPGGQWTYHNGWWRGFWTSFWNRFDQDICFVVLCNNKRSSHADKKGLAAWLAGGGYACRNH